MARSSRSDYLSPNSKDFVFVMCRSARTTLVPSNAGLISPADAHRVEFIESLLCLFSRFFCISIHSHAVLHSELRILLQSHPDAARSLDDFEVARRWLNLCPSLRLRTLRSVEPTEKEIVALAADGARIAEIRIRLSDIAWFLRLLQQRISLFCNREDDYTGRFWSDRFRSILLVEHKFYWLAMANVDLSAVYIDPDKPFSVSEFTSALLRLRDLLEAQERPLVVEDSAIHSNAVNSEDDSGQIANPTVSASDTVERNLRGGYLAPLPLPSDDSQVPTQGEPCQLRQTANPPRHQATFEYLELLTWIKRASDGEKNHPAPAWLSQLLRDIRLTEDALIAFVRNFDSYFSHVAGSPAKMDAFRTRSGRRRAWVTPEARLWFRKCELQLPTAPLS
jgi:hypothetical protein